MGCKRCAENRKCSLEKRRELMAQRRRSKLEAASAQGDQRPCRELQCRCSRSLSRDQSITFRSPQSPHNRQSPIMKRLFQVSTSDFSSKQVECSGCSGDALLLALKEEKIDYWKVNRKSPDGRDWFFEVTISGVRREFKVHTL